MSTKWTRGSKALHATVLQMGDRWVWFQDVSKQSTSTPPPWAGRGGGDGGVLPSRRVSARSRKSWEQASGGSSSNSDRIPPPPWPQSRRWAPLPRRKTATARHRASLKGSPPAHLFLQGHPKFHPTLQVRGPRPPAISPRSRSSGQEERASRWHLILASGSGFWVRVPGHQEPGSPSSRARLPVRGPSPHLAAAHDVGVLRQQVHHLPFAFVAPLRTEHHRHPVSSGPRPGAAAIAVGQGGCRRVGLGERHGSSDARKARRRGGRRGVSELNCSAAASHMQRKKEPEAGPAPAPPGRHPPASPRPALRHSPLKGVPWLPRAGRPRQHRPQEEALVAATAATPDRGHAPSAAWRATPVRTSRAEKVRGGASRALPLQHPAYPLYLSLSNWRGAEARVERRTTNPSMQRSGLRRCILGPLCLPSAGLSGFVFIKEWMCTKYKLWNFAVQTA